jgi:hypothetical protein
MGILAENHPFPILDGDRGVKHPPFEVVGGLATPLEEDFKVFDPLLKNQIFILFFDKERDLSFLHQKE